MHVEILVSRQHPARYGELGGPQVAPQGQAAVDERRRVHTGDAARPLEDVAQQGPVESLRRLIGDHRRGAALPGPGRHERPDAHRQHILGVDAEVDAAHAGKAREEQAGAHQQHAGERDLDRDERAAKPPIDAARRRAPPLWRPAARGAARVTQHRHQAEDHRAADRGGDHRRQHAEVDRDPGDARHVRRERRSQRRDADPRQAHAEGCGRQRQEQALHEEAPHQVPAGGAEGGADLELAAARARPHQHQIGDVQHAMSRTAATAASSSSIHVRTPRVTASCSGSTSADAIREPARRLGGEPRRDLIHLRSRALERTRRPAAGR